MIKQKHHINMEKIYYDDTTYIWKTKLNLINENQLFLKEANSIIKSQSYASILDAYPYRRESFESLNFIDSFKIERKMDEIYQTGINKCIEIYNENNISYNIINADGWVNVVRSKNPVQYSFHTIDKYHTHTEISKATGKFIPHYTWVYYIQMPDVMNDEDGVLYFKSIDGKEYSVKPEEDDLIIMEGNMPHSPNNAPQSTIDRIVLAGNVGFDYIKKEKTLI
jgi:hypothetical protein